MIAEFSAKPDPLQYMPLPDGRADAWLRENIVEGTDEEGNTKWTADEIYIRTELSKEEVTEQFDTLFEKGKEQEEAGSAEKVTLEERVNTLEQAFMELAEVVANG